MGLGNIVRYPRSKLSASTNGESSMDEYRLRSDFQRSVLDVAPTAGIDARQSIEVLRRGRWWVIGTAMFFTAMMAAFVYLVPPRYTAELTAVFEPRGGEVLKVDASLPEIPQDEASVLNKIEIFRSRSLAERVVDSLKLQEDPEFNADLAPKRGAFAWIRSAVAATFGVGPSPRQPVQRGEEEDVSRQRVVDNVLHRLEIQQIGRSRSAVVRVTGSDPVVAARVANALGDQYVVAHLEDKLENARRASDWLASHVARLREDVRKAEGKVEAYREQHNLLQGERATLVTQQISDLNTKLIDANIASRAADANLAQARKLARVNDTSSAVPVLQSELIRKFREQELDLERRDAELSDQYGPRHPLIAQLGAEKVRLQAKISAEIARIVRGLESEVEISQAREKALASDLEKLKQELGGSNEASVGLRSLERDAEASRLLLQRFMAAFMETSATEDVRSVTPDVRIVSRAAVPESPSFPRTSIMIVGALVSGCVFGIVFAFGLEALDATYRGAEQVQADTQLPVLAHVPKVSFARLRKEPLIDLVLTRPKSAYAESIRSLGTSLFLRAPQGTLLQTILFVSSQPGEGKTTTALSFARMQAAAGRNVVIVDADIRRSKVAEILQLTNTFGLTDLLMMSGPAGEKELREAVRVDPKSGAHVINAGSYSVDGAQLFTANKFEALFALLQGTYELIVIDSPPVSALSDALVLSRKADATIVTIAWGATRRHAAKYLVQQLSGCAKNIVGVVLSKIDVNQQARYSHGDSMYYAGKAKAYYQDA